MAFGNNNSLARFVNISQGKIVVKENEQKVEWGYVEGYLTNIEIVEDVYMDKKYDKIVLTLVDDHDTMKFQFKLDSGYGRAFICAIPNADLSQSIRFSPKYEEVDQKKKTSMFLSQGTKALKWAFTRDNPGEMPPLEDVTFKGQTMKDNSKQIEFMKHLLLNVIKPKLVHPGLKPEQGTIQPGPVTSGSVTAPAMAAEDIEAADDLPF